MRFLRPEQQDVLSALIAEGVVLPEKLQNAVGEAAIDLWEALCTHDGVANEDAWIEWCVRNRLARVNGVRVSPSFLKGLGLSESIQARFVREWCIPFTKNSYGQFLVAVLPGTRPNEALAAALGGSLVLCGASFPEWKELRSALSRNSARGA